jgi:hypothetical protein
MGAMVFVTERADCGHVGLAAASQEQTEQDDDHEPYKEQSVPDVGDQK